MSQGPDEVRRAGSEDAVRLLEDVEGIRRRRQRDSVRLLQELTPHLRAARMVERELDRHLARRFNVFRYVRDDELGLSQIIAELLDPAAEHGQGTTFLEAMLELLGIPFRFTGTERIRVLQERQIPGPRFIDVTVDIPTGDGLFCLAFENKPYAEDQPGQCCAYLEFLREQYEERCLLVYLPPRYRMPDESSLPREHREWWKDHFCVLPYVADHASSGDDDHSDGDSPALVWIDSAGDAAFAGDGASLADWFGTCCKLCDAERLRWSLREAQLYCQDHFGESTMTDTEARYIRKYLDENPRHVHAAFAVARAWPAVKDDVCRRFLEHLRDRVEERVRNAFPEIAGDLHVGCYYGEKRSWWSSYLCIFRPSWARCKDPLDLGSDGRTAVALTCRRGPKSWHWGVCNGAAKGKMSKQERQRCDELERALKERDLSLPYGDDNWPQFQWSSRYGDWTDIVPELIEEIADKGGDVTDHYVSELLKVAEKAIPAIDNVEAGNRSLSVSRDS